MQSRTLESCDTLVKDLQVVWYAKAPYTVFLRTHACQMFAEICLTALMVCI